MNSESRRFCNVVLVQGNLPTREHNLTAHISLYKKLLGIQWSIETKTCAFS